MAFISRGGSAQLDNQLLNTDWLSDSCRVRCVLQALHRIMTISAPWQRKLWMMHGRGEAARLRVRWENNPFQMSHARDCIHTRAWQLPWESCMMSSSIWTGQMKKCVNVLILRHGQEETCALHSSWARFSNNSYALSFLVMIFSLPWRTRSDPGTYCDSEEYDVEQDCGYWTDYWNMYPCLSDSARASESWCFWCLCEASLTRK